MTAARTEYHRKWRAKNRQHVRDTGREKLRKWRDENREHYAKYQREYGRLRRAKAKLEKLNNVN